MTKSFPIRQFRLGSGYSFESSLEGPRFRSNNLLVGGFDKEGDAQALFLGKLAEYGKMNTNIWIDTKGAHVIYVMGKRRSGKSYTLGTIAESLASSQWINQRTNGQAILLLDTLNVFTAIHHNVADVYGSNSREAKEQDQWGLKVEDFPVVLFYPKGAAPPPEGVSRELAVKPADLSAEDWAAVFGVDTFSDPVGQLLAEIYDKVAIEGYTNSDGNSLPAKGDYNINDFLICLNSSPDIERFHTQTIEAVRRYLRALERQSIFSDDGMDIKELFKVGQISIVLLRDIDYNLRGLFIGTLIKNIMRLRGLSDGYERLAEIQRRKSITLREDNMEEAEKCQEQYYKYIESAKQGLPRGWILIDEAHNYIPAKGIVASQKPLRQYVNEGRNLGLSIVVATQQPSGLDPSIRRNADILIIHSMSMRDDIDTAHGMLNTLVPETVTFGREMMTSRVFEQLIRSLDLGYAIVSNDRVNRIFPVKVRPRITVHGGKEY
jgi:hypothetical protein